MLHLLAGGATNQQIAEQLVIALATAKKHVANILSKLGAENCVQAIARARERDLL
ncbi:LuxR C-terminal-related transcriptional regulator [Ktedonobacter sp. SOSP1-52]|uniref:LuxR C-terminal-related transcriptional regulator n=1 Tax=Ktedonobacter sp. SOSP1-52 TaxID=2778366 RepID=UPI001F416A0F|nr:LuxR C-terminal-related transcriptional regulator [Ktedonobacter sp. SOSP1-52]